MVLCYSRRSAPSATLLAETDDDIVAVRRSGGDVNWGRARANTSLNPDISNCTNKRVMRELFKEHGVPMPKLVGDTGGRRSLFDFRRLGIEWDYPIVGRPDQHTKGRGFWKCNNFQDVQRAIRGTRRKKAATHFMEYIEAPHEYRVHVFKGKSIRISEKDFGTSGETATGAYTTIKPTGPVKHVRRAAKQAVEALGLDFGCVDILASDDKCWVLEVNAAPHLGGTLPELYADAFRRYFNGDWEE